MTLISYLTRQKTSSLFFYPFKMAFFLLSTGWHWCVFYVNVLFKICIPSGDVLILHGKVRGRSQRGAGGGGGTAPLELAGVQHHSCSVTHSSGWLGARWHEGLMPGLLCQGRPLTQLRQPAGLLKFARWARVCTVGRLSGSRTIGGNTSSLIVPIGKTQRTSSFPFRFEYRLWSVTEAAWALVNPSNTHSEVILLPQPRCHPAWPVDQKYIHTHTYTKHY